MDCDSFVFSSRTQTYVNDLQNPKDLFDFSSLDKIHDLFSNENKMFVGEVKNETPKKDWIDEFISLRSKAYFFR